jgi:hypothetical protein
MYNIIDKHMVTKVHFCALYYNIMILSMIISLINTWQQKCGRCSKRLVVAGAFCVQKRCYRFPSTAMAVGPAVRCGHAAAKGPAKGACSAKLGFWD